MIQVIYDVSSFIIFFMAWILFYSIIYRVMGIKFGGDDYPGINDNAIYPIQIFRNSLGDIAAPDYSYWTHGNNSPSHDLLDLYASNSMYWLVWVMFVMTQLFLLIILLNFLIAIISTSYKDVMD